MTDQIQDHYDVVIIGAGMAGMACGTLCARGGLRTLVLERHTKYGGYNQYFGKEPTFDSDFHFAGGGGPGGWIHNLLVEVGLNPEELLIRLDPAYRLVFPDHELLVPPDPDQFAGLLARHFPAEADNIRRLFTDLRVMGDAYRSLASPPSMEGTEGEPSPLLARYADATAQALLSDYVFDPRLQAVLAGLWPFHGLPPSRLSALDFARVWHTVFGQGGVVAWKGGAKAFGLALAGVVEAHGGQALVRSRVRRILIEDVRAVGVELETGQRVAAGAVVSTADPYQTWWELIGSEHADPAVVERLRAWEPSLAIMHVHLLVGMPLDLPAHATIVHDGYDLDAAYHDVYASEPAFKTLVVTQLDREDPERVAPGQHLVVLMAPMPYHRPDAWGGHASTGRNAAYRTLESYAVAKNRLANRLVAKAERIIPGLSQGILQRKVATPLTMERYTWNYHGAAFGWANTPHQAGVHRPGARTSIAGLYQAGHWCFPGSGVPSAMLSGRLAAEAILASTKRVQ
jgi:phytoene dehydrogenase-like protein